MPPLYDPKGDTFGYDAQGQALYDPGQYDQFGVYMGQRGQVAKAASTTTAPGFNQWSSTLPFDQWVKQYAAQKLKRESAGGLTQVTAKQGTPEYRQQVAQRQKDAQAIADWGGNAGNMGVQAAKAQGLGIANKFSGAGGTLSARAMAQARDYYARAQAQQKAAAPAASVVAPAVPATPAQAGHAWANKSFSGAGQGTTGGVSTAGGAGGTAPPAPVAPQTTLPSPDNAAPGATPGAAAPGPSAPSPAPAAAELAPPSGPSTPGPDSGTLAPVAAGPSVPTAPVGRPSEQPVQPAGAALAPAVASAPSPAAAAASLPTPAAGVGGAPPPPAPAPPAPAAGGSLGASQNAVPQGPPPMNRVPHTAEIQLMPPGTTVETPIGTLIKDATGKAKVTLNAEGQRRWSALHARQFKNFGYHPSRSDPNFPQPELIPGQPSYNAFDNSWVR